MALATLRRALPHALAALGLAVLVLTLALRWPFILDDAFISLRYARHLAEGLGVRYNLTGVPVEGYTNFLWVALGALLEWLLPVPEIGLLALNVVAGVGLGLVAYGATFQRAGPGMALLMAVWVVTTPALAAWYTGGLETALFALLFLAAALSVRALYSGVWIGPALLCALACLARPEGYLLLATVGLVGSGAFGRELRLPRKVFVRWGLCASVPPAIHLGWKLVYYGALLPNTFVAKVPAPYPSLGARYLGLFLTTSFFSPFILAAVPVAAVAAFRLRKIAAGTSALLLVLAQLAAAYLVYVLLVGGDHFEFRLVAPAAPVLAFLLFELLWLILEDGLRLRSGVVQLLVAMVVVAFVARASWSTIKVPYGEPLFRLRIATADGQARANYAEQWRPVGDWIARFTTPGERISSPAAGVIPYVAERETLDLHGLNDRDVARVPVARRGVLGHERNATWEQVKDFGVHLHVDDLRFRARLSDFPSDVRGDRSRIIALLPSGLWLNMGTPRDATQLRRDLRHRGAIVAAGPEDDVDEANTENARNLSGFARWTSRWREQTEARLKECLDLWDPGPWQPSKAALRDAT